MSDQDLPIIFEFTHPDFSTSIRALLVNEEPHFVAADVGAAIKLTNIRVSLGSLADDEKGVSLVYTPGGAQKMVTVTESGFYTLVLRCDDAHKEGTAAFKFRRWVTSEVLPALRKNGSYTTTPKKAKAKLVNTEPKPIRITGALINAVEKVLAHKLKLLPGLSQGSQQMLCRQYAAIYGVVVDVPVVAEAITGGAVAKMVGRNINSLKQERRYKELRKDKTLGEYRLAEVDLCTTPKNHSYWNAAGRDAVLAAFRPASSVVPFRGGEGNEDVA